MSDIDDYVKAFQSIMKNGELDRERGSLKAEGARFLIFSCKSYVSTQKRTESLVGFDAAGVLIYEANRGAGLSGGEIIRKGAKIDQKDNGRMISSSLDFMRLTGWGLWELGKYDKVKTVLTVKDSPIALEYGQSNRAVCHAIRGLIAGFAEYITGLKRECIEVLCKAKGDDHCEFIVAAPEDMTRIALERSEKP
jgi:predicted hydrocarbon binding protein